MLPTIQAKVPVAILKSQLRMTTSFIIYRFIWKLKRVFCSASFSIFVGIA